MHDTRGMRRTNRRQKLQANPGRRDRRQRAFIPYDIAEQTVRKPERGKLQHHPEPPLVFGDVVHTNNVRVIKPSHRTSLPESPLPRGSLPHSARLRRPGDLLDRHVPVQQLIPRQPDHPHPAPADDNPKPVPASEKAARLSTTHHGGLPGAGTS